MISSSKMSGVLIKGFTKSRTISNFKLASKPNDRINPVPSLGCQKLIRLLTRTLDGG